MLRGGRRVECGYCSPGILMKAESLLRKNPAPTRQQVTAALAGNLCRCTGYVKVVDAVLLAAGVRAGGPLPAVDRSGRVGSRTARYQGRELALGDKPYVNDLSMPGMLHGAVRSPTTPARGSCGWTPRGRWPTRGWWRS